MGEYPRMCARSSKEDLKTFPSQYDSAAGISFRYSVAKEGESMKKIAFWDALADAFCIADDVAGLAARAAAAIVIGGLAMVIYGLVVSDDGQAIKAGEAAIWLGAGGAAIFVAAVVVHCAATPAASWADAKWAKAYEAETGHPPVVEPEDEY